MRMRGIPVVVAFALALAVGCADGDRSGDDDGDLLARLQALPGVTVTEQSPVHAPPGYRYFVLQVTQPVDHSTPAGRRSSSGCR